MKIKAIALLTVALCMTTMVHARPDSHAPIGVMGDHLHKAGEWMVSYRYMHMNMDGNRRGTDSLTTSQVLDDYMMAPLNMTMDMHMFGAMVGINDNITAMLMLPYTRKTMDIRMRSGMEVERVSEGLGDVKASLMFRMSDNGKQKWHSKLGLSFPTGSIDEDHNDTRLPYPMQLGSGTVDVLLGLTFVEHFDTWSWGSQGNATIRAAVENENNYALGDRFDTTVWAAKKLNEEFSSSLRLTYAFWNNIEGADDDLNPMMTPTAERRQNGERVDLAIGLNFLAQNEMFKGHRLALEAGVPIYEEFATTQMESEWFVTLGWQKQI